MAGNQVRQISLVQAEEREQRMLSIMHGLAYLCCEQNTGPRPEFGSNRSGPYPVPVVPLTQVEEQSLMAGVRAALALLHDADRVFNLQPTVQQIRRI